VTSIARRAEVLVPLLFFVFVVHLCLVMFVTEDALKHGKARGIDMAIGAIVPFLTVLAGIDREVLRIMIPIGRNPS
jgi:hypothetical protein